MTLKQDGIHSQNLGGVNEEEEKKVHAPLGGRVGKKSVTSVHLNLQGVWPIWAMSK